MSRWVVASCKKARNKEVPLICHQHNCCVIPGAHAGGLAHTGLGVWTLSKGTPVLAQPKVLGSWEGISKGSIFGKFSMGSHECAISLGLALMLLWMAAGSCSLHSPGWQ